MGTTAMGLPTPAAVPRAIAAAATRKATTTANVSYGNEDPGHCLRNSSGDANYLSNLFVGWFLTSLFASFFFLLSTHPPSFRKSSYTKKKLNGSSFTYL